jgi:hypothetical protein
MALWKTLNANLGRQNPLHLPIATEFPQQSCTP